MALHPSKDMETFPKPEGDFVVRFECPEFTALCPKTGQPDFACIRIWYKPTALCVELKALKMYLWGFRQEGHFHEQVTNMILADLVKLLDPKWLMVEGDFWVRGGIHTLVHASHGDVPESLRMQRATSFTYSPH